MLSGKRVLVTGAAGGLGSGVVDVLLRHGAEVVAVDRTRLDRDDVEFHEVDLLESSDAAPLATVGRVDGLAHLVGGFAMGSDVHATDEETWNRMWALNVKSLNRTLAGVVPGMRATGGSIVTVGARNGLTGVGSMGAYSASKSAVHRITESLAAELAGSGVRVNSVLPSIIDTPANREAMPDMDRSGWVSPEGIGEVIAFLLSDRSRAVHGALVPVYGSSAS